MDLDQTSNYNKLSCQSYIEAVLDDFGWSAETNKLPHTPMFSSSTYINSLESAYRPTDSDTIKRYEKEKKFGLTVPNIKVCGRRIERMEEDVSGTLMAIASTATSSMINQTVKAHILV